MKIVTLNPNKLTMGDINIVLAVPKGSKVMINRRKYINNTFLRNIIKYKHCFFEDKVNDCYISVKIILELKEPFYTSKGICLIDKNYYIVEIIPLHENYCIRIFLDNKKNVILYYFDITYQNGFDNVKKSIYYDDLYLDVVKQKNNIKVLDEDELIEALDNGKINKSEYELAIIKKDELIKSLKDNNNKYLNIDYLKYL